MNDNKSRDIFYAVIAIATLVVALIGATLAYFSMTATSSEGAVSAKGAIVSINYEDGQKVLAQAENLIPVTFPIMQQLYSANLEAINTQANTEYDENDPPRRNLCQDGVNPNYEVCSIFRFSVSNDTAVNIKGTLRTESNSFSNLYYGIRDVTCAAPDEDDCWLTLDADGETPKYLKLDTCQNGTDTACYTEDTTRVYNTIAQKPLFGYDTGSTFKEIEANAGEKKYDVVLFILEKGTEQDEDQGKSYSGNLFIETVGGQHITGQVQ